MQNTIQNPAAYLAGCRERYRADALNDILPFWLRHGRDSVNGGVYTCLDRRGNLMDTTKSVWFQGRCAFTYAFAYNNLKADPEYLDFAKSCIDFIEKHCFDPEDGRMYFEVTAEGRPLRKRRYIFSESFAVIAFAEYAIATGSRDYALKALALFKRMVEWLETPGALEPKYLPEMQAIGHSITMILINTGSRVLEALQAVGLDDDGFITTRIDESMRLISGKFMHPEFKALLETVTPDGQLIDTLNGRTVNPGHCIETAWFILEEAKKRGWDPELKQLGLTILDWSWDLGWDKEYSGIINFVDCKGFPPQDYSQDMKFWWPQCETVLATLYAYEATGDPKYLEMHRMADEWMYGHFPDRVYGEWYGYLHRDGSVAQPAKGNLFKGPFHIPRMLIKAPLIIDSIKQKMENVKSKM